MQLLRGIVATALGLFLMGVALFFSAFVLLVVLAVAVPVGLAIFFYMKRKIDAAESAMEIHRREHIFDDDTGVVHDVEVITIEQKEDK